MRRLVAAMLVAAIGCGGDDSCDTGVAADGTVTVAAGGACLRGGVARARSGGAWHDDVTVTLTEVDGGALVVLEAAPPVEAFELRFEGVDADRMLQQGYHSWSFSGAVVLPASVPAHDDGEPAFAAPETGEVFDEVLGVSYGSALLGRETGDRVMVGAASSLRANTGVAVTGGDAGADVRIVYGVSREPLPADGSVVRSEPIAIVGAAGDRAALRLYAAQLGAALPVDTPAAKKPPGGWFSWNQHFEDIDQALIRDHAAFVADQLAPRGMPLVEIDDGWEGLWGDWVENDRFADGLDTLVGELDDAGLVAGIWMAPFLVDTESAMAATLDASYYVRDASGEPLRHKFGGAQRTWYVLDGSNPDAMAVATDAIERLRDAGVRFFKLDFLYAGAFPGQRGADVTGVEAFRTGMAMLRQAAGPDAVINACGVPIMPVIGLADSLRVGADTAFTTPDLDWSMVAYAARSYAARWFLYDFIWPDADQVQVREPYTAAQAEAGVAVAALAGPAYSLGDDLVLLPDDRFALAVDAAVIDLAGGQPASPVDVLATPSNEVVTSPGVEAVRYPNWTEAPPPTRFEAVGASGDHYSITFDWQGEQGVTIDTVQP